MAIKLPLILTVVIGALVSGCAPLVTQSPGDGLSPVNAVSDGEDKRVILAGSDVVAYFTDKTYKQGSPAIKSVYKGVTFRFASAEHKALFDAAPEKYIPQFGGYCTNGMIMQSVILLASNPSPTEDDIRAGLANNLCRCGSHLGVIRAVQAAAASA